MTDSNTPKSKNIIKGKNVLTPASPKMSQGKKCTNNPILYITTEDNANETVSLEDKFLDNSEFTDMLSFI